MGTKNNSKQYSRLLQLTLDVKHMASIERKDDGSCSALSAFAQDLEHYTDSYEQFTGKSSARKGWNSIIHDNLDKILKNSSFNRTGENAEPNQSAENETTRQCLKRIKRYKTKIHNEREKIQTIYYSQNTCNYKFSSSNTRAKKHFIYRGMRLTKAAKKLKSNPNDIHTFFVTIFWHKTGRWVALNNRSLAICCIAGLAPRLRIASSLTSNQKKRFTEEPNGKIRYTLPENKKNYTLFKFCVNNIKNRPPSSAIALLKNKNQTHAQLLVHMKSSQQPSPRFLEQGPTSPTSKLLIEELKKDEENEEKKSLGYVT